jgi:hypothetical protein
MYGSVAELIAGQPGFNHEIRGSGRYPFRQPVLPGELRSTPAMQNKMQPAVPPVRKAADDLLAEFMSRTGVMGGMVEMSDMGGMA